MAATEDAQVARSVSARELQFMVDAALDTARQPYFHDGEHRVVGALTNTDRATDQTFCLGLDPGLDSSHFDFLCEKLEKSFGLNF